jgi:hypothetical protein
VAAQSYTVRASRTGPAGLKELIVTIINVSSADTVDFKSDLDRIVAMSVIGDTRSAPGITAIAAGQIAGTVFTAPAVLAWANDDADLVVVGPSITP